VRHPRERDPAGPHGHADGGRHARAHDRKKPRRGRRDARRQGAAAQENGHGVGRGERGALPRFRRGELHHWRRSPRRRRRRAEHGLMLPGRRLVRILLLVVVPVIAIAIGLEWYARSTRWAETENAYVKANVIAISAEVSGRVVEVKVRDQQRVERGALLFAIDPVPFQLAVQRAEAELGVTRTAIETLRAEYRTALRETEEAAARIAFLSRQLDRQRMLKEKGMTREELYDDAKNNLDNAEKRIASLKESSSRSLA